MTFRYFLQTKGYADNTINAYESHVREAFRHEWVQDERKLSISDITGLIGRILDNNMRNAVIQYREFRLVDAYFEHLVRMGNGDNGWLSFDEINKCVTIMSRVLDNNRNNRDRLYDIGRGVGRFLDNTAQPIHNTAINEFVHFVDLHPDWFNPDMVGAGVPNAHQPGIRRNNGEEFNLRPGNGTESPLIQAAMAVEPRHGFNRHHQVENRYPLHEFEDFLRKGGLNCGTVNTYCSQVRSEIRNMHDNSELNTLADCGGWKKIDR